MQTFSSSRNSIYRAFGRAVADRRRSIGKRQLEVAQQIGLSRASLANIERGAQKVFLHQALALTEALELDSSHEIIPSRAAPSNRHTAEAVNLSGAKDLSKDQRFLVNNIVGYFAGSKRVSK